MRMMMMRRRMMMVTKAGAIRDKVDILTAPSSETSRSSQGTVTARPTEGESCENEFGGVKNSRVKILRPILVKNSTTLNILRE